ncbi:LapA family protein [Rhodopirellula sp.]|nr:LapA family protein [Rhodopirellula sp.]
MSKIYLSFTAIAFAAITIFAIQNRETISVNFLTASVQIPKVAVIMGSYVLGMVTGWGLFGLIKHAIKKSKIGSKRAQVNQ